MRSKKEPQPISETLDKLVELVESQQKALNMANNLLDMKSRLVELCEEETEIYRKKNNRSHKIIFGLFVCLAITTIGWLISVL